MRKSKQIKIKNEYLNLIYMIGYDYDGCDTVEGLKEVIDQLVDYAKKGLKNDDKSCEYTNFNGDEFNILRKKIKKGKGENFPTEDTDIEEKVVPIQDNYKNNNIVQETKIKIGQDIQKYINKANKLNS